VHSLSSLLGGELDEPSLLPFQFLQHVVALLPANYFGSIFFRRVYGSAQRCPSDHLLQFLDVVPNGSIQDAPAEGSCTKVILWGGGSITRDELQDILSHPFHPSVQLWFDPCPFSDVVPMIEMLKETQSLCSVKIPCQVIGSVGLSPVFELSVQSSNLMMHVGCISPSLLRDTQCG
jgi:hypothetical protein